MKCASWIQGHPAMTSPAINSAAEMMERFMAPLVAPTAPGNRVSAALKLRQSAHELLMLEVRQSRTLIRVELPLANTLYGEKEYAVQFLDLNESGAASEISFRGKPILFALSGVLVMADETGRRTVASKAHVVM